MTNPTFPDLDFAEEGKVVFHAVSVDFPSIDVDSCADWLEACAKTYGHTIVSLSYVFVSDEALYEMNVEHLQHHTYTDIITFDLSDEAQAIEGECYISLDRVLDNAETLDLQFLEELKRVLVHGLLHLCGLGDKSESESTLMRRAEDDCLAAYPR